MVLSPAIQKTGVLVTNKEFYQCLAQGSLKIQNNLQSKLLLQNKKIMCLDEGIKRRPLNRHKSQLSQTAQKCESIILGNSEKL